MDYACSRERSVASAGSINRHGKSFLATVPRVGAFVVSYPAYSAVGGGGETSDNVDMECFYRHFCRHHNLNRRRYRYIVWSSKHDPRDLCLIQESQRKRVTSQGSLLFLLEHNWNRAHFVVRHQSLWLQVHTLRWSIYPHKHKCKYTSRSTSKSTSTCTQARVVH